MYYVTAGWPHCRFNRLSLHESHVRIPTAIISLPKISTYYTIFEPLRWVTPLDKVNLRLFQVHKFWTIWKLQSYFFSYQENLRDLSGKFTSRVLWCLKILHLHETEFRSASQSLWFCVCFFIINEVNSLSLDARSSLPRSLLWRVKYFVPFILELN